LGKNGSPALKIRIKGPFGDGKEFDATIDTGFTGFLSIPLLKAIPLGLLLYGTTGITFADGSTTYRLTAKAQITVENESQIGIAILEPKSEDVLIGMEFLRLFKKAFFIVKDGVALLDETFIEQIAKAAQERLQTQESGPPSASSATHL
jgi:predicted aspartyl protease